MIEVTSETKKPITDLADTVDEMISENYMERFRAEYHQLSIRIAKLQRMVNAWDSGELKFQPTCPRSTYDLQLRAMLDYQAVLEARACMEHVIL